MARLLSRRTVLRGCGTAIALPLLDAMTPAAEAAAAAVPPNVPLRMAFVYSPNGMHMADWTPEGDGSAYKLPATLEPLEKLRGEFSVLTGLAHQKANANGDGGGDHARAMTTFLTGVQARKTAGADIHAGVSVDQVAARQLGKRTRLPSLEIGAEGGGRSGNCDSGYSCAYSSTISWRSDTQPVPKETDPELIFERLFEDGQPHETEAARARRLGLQKSVIDFALEDANRLGKELGAADKRKLDEYLGAVRELERRIERAGRESREGGPKLGMKKPEQPPAGFGEHLKILADLLVLAFQTDSTRVATFVFANEGSNRSYAFIEVPEGHHDLSHHGNDAEKQAKIQKINRFHVEHVAYFLGKLKAAREGDKSLLDRSMIVYGSGIADGNRHQHEDLPMILAGGGAGSLQPGRHVRFSKGTPATNLYLSLLDRAGVKLPRLGDSTGRVSDI
jgi:hypothetical protein